MEFNDFEFAPNKQVIDNITAVPIDIYKLEAEVVFDVSIHKCKVISNMYFKIGNENGNPFFDLRQYIQNAYLNDEYISIDKIRHHKFTTIPNSELIIIEKNLPSNSSNILKLEYELNQPLSPESKAIEWNSNSLYFDFWFSDLNPGRYLEMWFPSNLIYDHFEFHLNIHIINSNVEHTLFSNGEINKIGNNSWIIDFPNNFTSLSHMLYICPKNNVEEINDILVSPDNSGKNINLNVFKLKNNNHANINRILDNVKSYISENISNIGPYIHGNKFLCFIWESPGGRSMEYDGAVTTTEKYLKHETFHSWFARGLKPATQNDSWFDEAWTCYNTDDIIQPVKTFNMSEAPVRLSSSENPFNRVTPGESFEQGIRFFSGLAAEIGSENLQSYMNSFYKENCQKLITTKQLETYLIEQSGKNIIQKYFNHFVYGHSE